MEPQIEHVKNIQVKASAIATKTSSKVVHETVNKRASIMRKLRNIKEKENILKNEEMEYKIM